MIKRLLVLSFLGFLFSCTDELETTYFEKEQKTSIEVSLEALKWDNQTRTSAEITETGVKYSWNDNDTISIYPDVGSQVEFLAKSSEGSVTTATFDGGAWRLKKGHEFCGFYPYNFRNRTRDNIQLDYAGQKQIGNGNVSGACARDYIYTESTPVVDDVASFVFKHLGAFLYLELQMPEDNEYCELTLNTREAIFPIRQKLDLSSGVPVLTNLTSSAEFTVELENISTTSEDETLKVAMFLPAVDLSSHDVYVTVTGTNGVRYSCGSPLMALPMEQGKAYMRKATMIKEGDEGFVDAECYNIRLLSVGNSFSCDAFAYVPSIIEDLLPNANVHIGIIYLGNTGLDNHWSYYKNNISIYQFYEYQPELKKWRMLNSKTAKYGFECDQWDFVSFQQVSSKSNDYSTFNPYLNNYIAEVDRQYPECEPIWLETHAYADGYKFPYMSDDMFLGIVSASKQVVEHTSIDKVIPYGAAIQNARHTALKTFGTYTGVNGIDAGQLSYEGTHLQAGIPRLIASLTSAQMLLDLYGIDNSVLDSEFKPSDAVDTAIKSPDSHGKVQSFTDQQYELAKQCAIKAIQYPYTISIIDNEYGSGSIKPTPWK